MKARKGLGMGMQDLLRLTMGAEPEAPERPPTGTAARRPKPAVGRRSQAATPVPAGDPSAARRRELEEENDRLRRRLELAEAAGGEPSPAVDGEALYLAALGALKEGRAAEALKQLLVLVHFQPGHVKAWNNLGVAFYELGLGDEAGAAFRRVLELEPDHPAARENLLALEAGPEPTGGDS